MEKYKIKVDEPTIEIDDIIIFDLKKDNFKIITKPHFFDDYLIENWIWDNKYVSLDELL